MKEIDNFLARRAFVAGPFTAAFSTGSEFHTETRGRLEALLSMVKRQEVPYFSSHETEKWGDDLEKPDKLLERDLGELHRCTHLLVYLNSVHSFGATIEMGYAIGLGRPILAIYASGSLPRSDFYHGLLKTGRVQDFEWSSDSKVEEEVRRFLVS